MPKFRVIFTRTKSVTEQVTVEGEFATKDEAWQHGADLVEQGDEAVEQAGVIEELSSSYDFGFEIDKVEEV